MRIYKLLKLFSLQNMEHFHKHGTVTEFLDEVGRIGFQNAIHVGTQSVTRAKTEGFFPDGWYWKTRNYCDEIGVRTPEHLFRNYEPRKEAC